MLSDTAVGQIQKVIQRVFGEWLSLSRQNRWFRGGGGAVRGIGRACGGAGGALVTIRGGGISKSATKAPRAGIGWEEKRGISTILRARSGSILAFVADLDILRRHGVREG